jgi:hypothetical protein
MRMRSLYHIASHEVCIQSVFLPSASGRANSNSNSGSGARMGRSQHAQTFPVAGPAQLREGASMGNTPRRMRSRVRSRRRACSSAVIDNPREVTVLFNANSIRRCSLERKGGRFRRLTGRASNGKRQELLSGRMTGSACGCACAVSACGRGARAQSRRSCGVYTGSDPPGSADSFE